MKKNKSSDETLRRLAEEKLSERLKKESADVNKVDTMHLLHELQVHQIELEMQNEQLTQSQAEVDAGLKHYTELYNELYDFAPVGYFTLRREGTIRHANLTGARLLGMARGNLIGLHLENFVPAEYRAVFKSFFKTVFENRETASCETKFLRGDQGLLWAHLKADIKDTQAEECRIVMMDVNDRKQVEDELRLAKEKLETANAELHIALAHQEKLAHTDTLTRINNRRHLFELAEHEYKIAARYHQPLSVIMFDIDHFKNINDLFGHAIGDKMLQLVTQAACAEMRSADVIGRYGGEEFVIILPMTHAQQAYPVAERIRQSVKAIRIPTEKGEASVTLSIGIIEIASNSYTTSVEDLIRYADKVMYRAKQAGRNRTEIGEPIY